MSNATVIASPEPPESAGNRPKTQLVISAMTVVTTLAMIMVMMLRYSLQPSTVELTSLSVPSFTANLSYPTVDWNSTWKVHVRIKNKETRWGARYDKVMCTLYNQEKGVGLRRVGRATVEPFGMAAEEEKTVVVDIHVHVKRPLDVWDFCMFDVRVEADTHFDVEARGVEGMLVSRCRPIDATCRGMVMTFQRDEGRLDNELSVPKLCEEGMPLDDAISIDGATTVNDLSRKR